MLGKISQIDYMQTLIQEYPEHKKIIEKSVSTRNAAYSFTSFRQNLEYVLRLKKTGKYKLYILSNLTDETYKYVKIFVMCLMVAHIHASKESKNPTRSFMRFYYGDII